MEDNETSKAVNLKQGYSLTNILFILLATVMLTLIFSAASSYFGGFAAGDAIDSNDIDQRVSIPIMIHMATVIPSVPLGGYILWVKKGDRLHKNLGKIWSILMMVTAISSFWIGSSGTGVAGSGLSFIHIFSVMTIVSIPLAIFHIKRGDVKAHYQAMQGVYFGLLIAGLLSFLPGRIMNILAFS